MKLPLNFSHQVLALAASCQALYFASHIALTGEYEESACRVLLDAIYALDTPSTTVLYPADQLPIGLQWLSALLSKRHRLSVNQQSMLKYLLRLNALAKKIQQDKALNKALHQRLHQAVMQRPFFEAEPDRALTQLSQLYLWLAQRVKSEFRMLGQAKYLHNHQHVNHIRALLLAALRAIVLWRQLGGNLWQLWWQRQAYSHYVQQYLIKQ